MRADEAVRATRQMASSSKDIVKATKEQINVQRQDNERIAAEDKEIRKQNEQILKLAQDADKRAKRSADAAAEALEQIEKHLKRM